MLAIAIISFTPLMLSFSPLAFRYAIIAIIFTSPPEPLFSFIIFRYFRLLLILPLRRHYCSFRFSFIFIEAIADYAAITPLFSRCCLFSFSSLIFDAAIIFIIFFHCCFALCYFSFFTLRRLLMFRLPCAASFSLPDAIFFRQLLPPLLISFLLSLLPPCQRHAYAVCYFLRCFQRWRCCH